MKKTTNLSQILQYLACPVCKGTLKNDKNLFCIKCKTKFTVVKDIPVLLKKKHMTEYFESQIDYFDDYSKEGPIFTSWMDSYLERLFKNLPFKKQAVVLDIATGDGYIALALAKKGYTVISLDLTLSLLLKLQKEAKKQKIADKILFVCAEATSLPIRNNSIDIVTANAIIEHIPEEKVFINEIGRVSKKNSGLMIATPLAYYRLLPFFIPFNYWHDKDIGHLRRYTGESLKKKFSQWDMVNVYYTGHIFKASLFLLAYIFKLPQLDALAEASDSPFLHIPYGGSNITAFFKRKK